MKTIKYIKNNKNRNAYKVEDNNITQMSKKVRCVSLDEEVIAIIESMMNNSRGSRFSPFVNDLLREHPEIKKRLKKK